MEGNIVKDVVCGKELDRVENEIMAEHGGNVYHFCSANCRARFEASPHDYVKKVA